MFARETQREAALDRCVDVLLEGGDWYRGLPEGEGRDEILELMRIAQWLLDLRSASRPPSGDVVRERVWQRVEPSLDFPATASPPGRSRPLLRPGWLPIA
ncbi:MAG: hypothetical protein ACM3S1_16940 [Hyphomicrobiales bacterium]